jgi:hypothetical protein
MRAQPSAIPPFTRLFIIVCLCLSFFTISLIAQSAKPARAPNNILVLDREYADDWSSDIDSGWRTHEGDNSAWASPGLDDSAWENAQLDDLQSSQAGWALGPSRSGWRWFRLHLKLHENHPDLALLIEGGEGTYELYVNGVQMRRH